jgi:hypothetical protein
MANCRKLELKFFSYFQCCGAGAARSRIRKEPHHLVGAGAGALTRCGSGSDGSGSNNGIKHGQELKNDTLFYAYLIVLGLRFPLHFRSFYYRVLLIAGSRSETQAKRAHRMLYVIGSDSHPKRYAFSLFTLACIVCL